MNREIEFRGKSLVTKEWLTGRLVVAGADLSNTHIVSLRTVIWRWMDITFVK